LGLSKRRKALITLATLIGTFLAALDATVVGTAMPTVIGELGGLELYPWAFASYLLAATVTGPVFGKLSDTYGRKPVYLAGIFLFLLGSVLAGTSQSMAALIFFRTIQGLGAGAVQPVAITIIGDIFELEARARIQGLFGAVWGISAVVGPAAGGFITDLISWRWVFYANVPFGIIAAVLLAATLSESFERRERSMDYLGTALLTGGLVAVLLALLGGGATELSVATLAPFFGGMAVLALFVLVEWRAEDPVVPLDLFSERIIAVSALGNVAMGGVLLGVSVYVPLFVQGALGGTAITAGAAVASLSIGWPVGSFVGGRLLLLFFGLSALAVATLFPHGTAKVLVSREEDYG
jgi:EmrB/QacA subfamily drug resistance transporter